MATPIRQPIHVDTLYDYRLMLADGRPVLGVIGGGHEQPFTAQEKVAIAAHAVACWNAGAEVERLREDAERYRWLRDVHSHHYTVTRYVGGATIPRIDGPELDAAIDAARKATP